MHTAHTHVCKASRGQRSHPCYACVRGFHHQKGARDAWASSCVVCKKRGKLVCCDGCINAVHLHCVGLRKVPAGAFYCPACQDLKKREPVKPAEDEWNEVCQVTPFGLCPVVVDGLLLSAFFAPH